MKKKREIRLKQLYIGYFGLYSQAGAYRPIRNVRKRLHNNLQISNFLGGGPQTPPFATPPPTFFYKNG